MNRKPRYPRKGLRVPTGISGLATIAVAIAITLLLTPPAAAQMPPHFLGKIADATPAAGASQNFFYYNAPDGSGNAYVTVALAINTTGAEIAFPAYRDFADRDHLGPMVTVPPFASVHLKWPLTGGGMKTLDIPEGLSVLTEMTDDHGATIRVPPLDRYDNATTVQVQGLDTNPPKRALVFVTSGTSVQFFADAKAIGEAIVCAATQFVPAPIGANRVVVMPPTMINVNVGFDGSYFASAAQFDAGGVQQWVLPTALPTPAP